MKLSFGQQLVGAKQKEDLDFSDSTMQDSDDDQDMNDDSFLDGDDTFFGGNGNDSSPMDKHRELLKELTDFDPVIKDTVNGWLGLVWDAEKEKYVRNPFAEPKMNGKGAAFYAGFLRTYAKKTNIITNLGEEQSRWIQKDIIEAVLLSLADKMEDFDIKSSSDLLILANEIIHSAFLVLFGAEDGKYSKLLSETSSRHEAVSYSGNPNGYHQQNMAQPRSSDKGFFSNLRRGLFGGK